MAQEMLQWYLTHDPSVASGWGPQADKPCIALWTRSARALGWEAEPGKFGPAQGVQATRLLCVLPTDDIFPLSQA